MPRQQAQKGFTLLELVLVVTIMGVISVIVGKILASAYNTFYVTQNINDIDYNGLLAVETVTNDIHNIRSAGDITSITATNLSFIDTAGTTITYTTSGATFTRNSQTLATGVNSIAFEYRDENYSVTATPANVRYITFSISLTQRNLSLSYSTMVGTRGMY